MQTKELSEAALMDDLNEFDGLLDYLGAGGSSLHAPDQRLQPQPQQPGLVMPHGQGIDMFPTGGTGIPLTAAAGSIPSMGDVGGMPPGSATTTPGTIPETASMPAAPTLNPSLFPGGIPGLPQHLQQAQPGAMGLAGLRAGGGTAGARGGPSLLGATFGGDSAAMPGLSNLGALGGLGALAGNLGNLGAFAGAGSLGQLDALLGLQGPAAAGMAAAGGAGMMLPRASVTNAAAGGGIAMPAGVGSYAIPFGGGAAAVAPPQPSAAHTAKGSGGGGGGGGGGRRGRSNPKPSRRSEYDLGSSDGELDSNSDSGGSSDGDAPLHKSSKKKREGGGGGGEDAADRRHAALQEKNRRAQRRFRERQKTKLQELHKQIEELAGKVSNLQTENAALHSRTSILEKVLDMRNEQIQVMQENKEVAEAELASLSSGPALVPLSPAAIKELTSEDIYRVYQTYVKELSVKLLEATRGSAAAAASPPPPATAGKAGGGGDAAGTAAAADAAAAGSQGKGESGSSGGEVAGAAVTASGVDGINSVAQAELERLVRELSVMLMRLGVSRPLEARKFIVFSRQYLGNTEKEVIELWKSVMKHIELSQEQMREIVELKRLFLTKIEPIMDERKHLNIAIQTNLPHDTFHTKSSISYIKAHEAVSKLRDNLRSEQHVVLEFAIAVFRGVFRPNQMAALLVRCYPAVPDALGIASALATELGEPDSPATQQLTMQLGGYAVHGSGSGAGPGSGAGSLLAIHPSLMTIDASVGVGQQLLQQQQAAAQQLLQQQHLLPLQMQQQQQFQQQEQVVQQQQQAALQFQQQQQRQEQQQQALRLVQQQQQLQALQQQQAQAQALYGGHSAAVGPDLTAVATGLGLGTMATTATGAGIGIGGMAGLVPADNMLPRSVSMSGSSAANPTTAQQ